MTHLNEKSFVYLQKEFNGMPAGTPLIKCEPSSAHLMAKALVGKDVEPAGFYHVPSVNGQVNVIRIPFFSGIVGEHHPDSKELQGPFVAGEIKITQDKLPGNYSALVTAVKDYPYLHIVICVDPDAEETNESPETSLVNILKKTLKGEKPDNVIVDSSFINNIGKVVDLGEFVLQ